MWNTSAPPGKIAYVPQWNLDIELLPVIMIDQEVIPGIRLSEFGSDLKGFDDFAITITYDQSTLFSGNLCGSDAISMRHQLLDDKENTDHSLSIKLDGKSDDHSCFHQGKSVSLGVKVNMIIDGVPINSIMTQVGLKNYMGENEVQTLEIKTPIYRWLLANQEYIMRDIF